MSTDRGFQIFPHGHADIVLAVDFNFYGNRLVTASSDHRLKVWNKTDGAWELVDEWRAHDAEITDVKWNGPFVGQILGSIGEDGYFKLWEEDVSQAPRSGRRFKLIMGPLVTKSKLPWMSQAFKNIGAETYLALITRDGNLSIMEPKDHDNLAGDWSDWMENHDFWVAGGPPPRSEETGFAVAFHAEKIPCWTAIAAGLDRKALSLAVAAMDVVKIFRTDRDKRLYLAAELGGATDIVRDVSWANGSMRGFDVLATASRDGAVRIYELRTPTDLDPDDPDKDAPQSTQATTSSSTVASSKEYPLRPTRSNAPSGIGASLAGGTTTANGSTAAQDSAWYPSRVKQVPTLVAELLEHEGPVWRVAFSHTADVLTSTGDDGKVRVWKRGLNSDWFEYAEIKVKDEP